MQLDVDLEPISARSATTQPPQSRANHALRAQRLSSPQTFRLERRVDGKLWVVCDATAVAVEVVRCFPWTEPTRFLSLRDSHGTEHAFIDQLEELDTESQKALGPGLSRSGFVLDIVRIERIEEDFELRAFVVDTLQGPRRFQTALDAWPRRVECGALVLEDVYGDLYRIAQPEKLDQRSSELLRLLVD